MQFGTYTQFLLNPKIIFSKKYSNLLGGEFENVLAAKIKIMQIKVKIYCFLPAENWFSPLLYFSWVYVLMMAAGLMGPSYKQNLGNKLDILLLSLGTLHKI